MQPRKGESPDLMLKTGCPENLIPKVFGGTNQKEPTSKPEKLSWGLIA